KPNHHFQRKSDSWLWNFSDLEPTLADDIIINTVPSWDSYDRTLESESRSQYASYLQHLEKWGEGHQRFKAVASSSLTPKDGRSYGPDNLAKWYELDKPDLDFAWCEG